MFASIFIGTQSLFKHELQTSVPSDITLYFVFGAGGLQAASHLIQQPVIFPISTGNV